jgi:hypothetical protein
MKRLETHVRAVPGWLPALAVAGAVSGCGAPMESSEQGGTGGIGAETVATTEEGLSTCPTFCNYLDAYEVDGSLWVGPTTSTDLCFPADYLGSSGNPDLQITNDNYNWQATGHGTLYCAKQCCFSSNGGSQDIRKMSGTFTATATASNFGQAKTSVNMWQSDAMPILTGVVHSTGEMTQTWEDGSDVYLRSPWTQSALLEAYAYRNLPVASIPSPVSTETSRGYSFFVGINQSGHQVKYKRYSATGGGGWVTMIPNTQGICVITDAADIWVNTGPMIRQFNGAWHLQHNGDLYVKAYANCYYYDQSQ